MNFFNKKVSSLHVNAILKNTGSYVTVKPHLKVVWTVKVGLKYDTNSMLTAHSLYQYCMSTDL